MQCGNFSKLGSASHLFLESYTDSCLFQHGKGKGKGESHVRLRTLGKCPLEGHLS